MIKNWGVKFTRWRNGAEGEYEKEQSRCDYIIRD